MTKFNEWVSSVAEAGRELLPKKSRQDNYLSLSNLCHELCTSKGEAMGTAIAHQVVKTYQALDSDERLGFFHLLYEDFSPDPQAIIESSEAYKLKQDSNTYRDLRHAIEAPRLHLFRCINMAPQGTATLIQIRKDLLAIIQDCPDFSCIDDDLKHLLISWFNRGFLTLEQISWRTPAHILEKLIAYEAVHEMSGWDDLRRRLADDRRCFAFFHPALEDEPLIFVEVALVKGIAGNVQELLAKPDDSRAEKPTASKVNADQTDDFDTAIFYSISNCQEGLKGISFGNFLIKQVVVELRNEFEQLKQFATLSPIPGFLRWLKAELKLTDSNITETEDREVLSLLSQKDWVDDEPSCEALRPVLTKLCAQYLSKAKKGTEPLDPVARFHLGNGAQISRLNWLGDRSANGMKQSAGMLVNYAYQLKKVEKNHEAYFNDGVISMSTEFQKHLK
jgi:malonyl-CoA decarboxylase